MDYPVIDYFFNAHQRVYWLYLCTSLLIASGYIYLKKEAFAHYLSAAIWWHPSARIDYGYFAVISLIKLLIIMPLILSSKEVGLFTVLQMQALFGYITPLDWSREAILAAYTLALFTVSDFTRYWLHRLMHAVPFLWRFHRVHHSAEVLNPLTFYRVHPVENALFGLRFALSVGIVTGCFLYLFGARIGLAEIIGVNALGFLFAAAGSNLRHSHIPLRYGDGPERWLISPYMHQLHHSKTHSRTNYGGALAVWDRMFGTLHVDDVKPLVFGTEIKHRNVTALLTEPFMMEKTYEKNPVTA